MTETWVEGVDVPDCDGHGMKLCKCGTEQPFVITVRNGVMREEKHDCPVCAVRALLESKKEIAHKAAGELVVAIKSSGIMRGRDAKEINDSIYGNAKSLADMIAKEIKWRLMLGPEGNG